MFFFKVIQVTHFFFFFFLISTSFPVERSGCFRRYKISNNLHVFFIFSNVQGTVCVGYLRTYFQNNKHSEQYLRSLSINSYGVWWSIGLLFIVLFLPFFRYMTSGMLTDLLSNNHNVLSVMSRFTSRRSSSLRCIMKLSGTSNPIGL